jgi:hypothetical protein
MVLIDSAPQEQLQFSTPSDVGLLSFIRDFTLASLLKSFFDL